MPCIRQRWGLREKIYVNSTWPQPGTQNMVKNFSFSFLMTVIVTVFFFNAFHVRIYHNIFFYNLQKCIIILTFCWWGNNLRNPQWQPELVNDRTTIKCRACAPFNSCPHQPAFTFLPPKCLALPVGTNPWGLPKHKLFLSSSDQYIPYKWII